MADDTNTCLHPTCGRTWDYPTPAGRCPFEWEHLVTLEDCVCGECFYCPDGYHSNDQLPCICTPDCILEDEDDEEPELYLVDLTGPGTNHGSIVLLEGTREDGTTVVVAAEPRLAQAALAALDDGAPVQVEVEPWQVWRVQSTT